MRLIDTHIHLANFPDVDAAFFKKLHQKGISLCVSISACEKDWVKTAELARKYADSVIPAFGLHPWYVGQNDQQKLSDLEAYLQAFPNALVGECGLDRVKKTDLDTQTDVFLKQIDLAEKYHRVLVVHAVKAVGLLEKLLPDLPERFILHSFNGRPEHLKPILDHNGYIGLSGSVLQNKTCRQILDTIPPERLLLESDAPDQGNEYTVVGLCAAFAEILAVDPEKLAERLYQNALEVLKHD
jgi:TatD DNase family protein